MHLLPVFLLTIRALPRPCAHPRLFPLLRLRAVSPGLRLSLATPCRRKVLEPEPLARQRTGVWLDTSWPQVGRGLNGLLSDEIGTFPRHP